MLLNQKQKNTQKLKIKAHCRLLVGTQVLSCRTKVVEFGSCMLLSLCLSAMLVAARPCTNITTEYDECRDFHS